MSEQKSHRAKTILPRGDPIAKYSLVPSIKDIIFLVHFVGTSCSCS